MNKKYLSTIFRIVLGITLFLIFLFIFSRAMTIGFSHDEYQFVSSAQLLVKEGALPYQDYPFLHFPYQIFINAIGIMLTPYHFLAARALTATANFFSIIVIAIILIEKRKGHNWLIKYLLVVLASFLFLFNPALKSMDGRALNHAFAGLFSLLAFYNFERALSRQKTRYFLLLLCGFFSALATGIRLSYLVIVPAFVIGIIFDSQMPEIREKIKRGIWFSTGVLLGLMPILVIFLQSPESFYYGNFTYIRLNTIYRELLGHENAMTLIEKFGYFFERELKNITGIFLYGMMFFVVVYNTYRYRKNLSGKITPILTLFMLGIFLLVASFSPTPLWPQYFFAPIPFFILFIFLGFEITPAIEKKVQIIAIILLILILASNRNYLEIPRSAVSLSYPSNWVPIQAHQFSSRLNSHLDRGVVLTMGSTFVLEAGLEIYPAFAVGPFTWRTSQFLAKETREKNNVFSPEDLPDYLSRNPPDAVLVGFGERFEGFTADDPGGLEAPLIRYAQENGYVETAIYVEFLNQNTTLWVKKE